MSKFHQIRVFLQKKPALRAGKHVISEKSGASRRKMYAFWPKKSGASRREIKRFPEKIRRFAPVHTCFPEKSGASRRKCAYAAPKESGASRRGNAYFLKNPALRAGNVRILLRTIRRFAPGKLVFPENAGASRWDLVQFAKFSGGCCVPMNWVRILFAFSHEAALGNIHSFCKNRHPAPEGAHKC